jgi:hypothetical protein
MTQSGRRGLARIERLFDALADPARGERTVVAVLLGYVALWTLYGAIAKGRLSQAPAARDGGGARVVCRFSHRRLGLLPARDG